MRCTTTAACSCGWPATPVFAAQYTVLELAAIVEEAHRLGLRVAAHCHGVAGIRAAVEARVDTLEHCSFQTPAGSEHDDAVIEEIALMSTDCGIPGVPHAALWEGMDVLRRLTGMAPVDVLRLATSTSAELLGLDDRGVLEAGRRADLLVVEGDPTEDLSALGRVRLVVAGGQVVTPARA